MAELLALAQEPIVESLPVGATESRRMDERGKERVRGHEEHYMKQAPYGTWHSPLAAADLARSAISLNYVEVSEGIPYWVESRPAEGGRGVVVTSAGNGAVRELTPAGFNARTRVHEYGGTPYVALWPGVWFHAGRAAATGDIAGLEKRCKPRERHFCVLRDRPPFTSLR